MSFTEKYQRNKPVFADCQALKLLVQVARRVHTLLPQLEKKDPTQ